jgi:uroporphyrinogen decarboxylase
VDFSVLPEQVKGFEDYPIRGGGSEPFLIYKDLRGQEQGMIDLVLNPDMVEYCLEKLFDLAYQMTLRILEVLRGQVTYTYIAEDMGGQKNLLFSPTQIRRFLLPGMRRMVELSHQAGPSCSTTTMAASRPFCRTWCAWALTCLIPSSGVRKGWIAPRSKSRW